MKGHVPTPPSLADEMVAELFRGESPEASDQILYPGVGDGPFVLAVERYCAENGHPVPNGVGIDLDPNLLTEAASRLDEANVELQNRDFLGSMDDLGEFRYIVGNPPYVPIEGLTEEEKERYKTRFESAVGRFDLYILFFEQAVKLLEEGGCLVFITPEKFEYVRTAEPLRRLLTTYHIEKIHHIREDAFTGKITFPTITSIINRKPGRTKVVRRDGSTDSIKLPKDGSSWASLIREGEGQPIRSGVTLGDVTERISPGVATGADSLFVQDREEVPQQLLGDWTYPTVSGKQLRVHDGPDTDSMFICPYDENGRLPPEDELGEYGEWAELHRNRLEDRHCVKKGKAWYGWHETPQLGDILQPKVLCKDITDEPEFWIDRTGNVVPRHTVYYIIPEEHLNIDDLLEYLNGPEAKAWLEANCQHASNGFYRLQTRVMEDLPVPEEWAKTVQETLV